ncbi:MAG: hypothetical protein ACTSQ8_17485 [Candidatus Helarchaeota archaeon]
MTIGTIAGLLSCIIVFCALYFLNMSPETITACCLIAVVTVPMAVLIMTPVLLIVIIIIEMLSDEN